MATYAGVTPSNSLIGSKKQNVFRIATPFSSYVAGVVVSIHSGVGANTSFAGSKIYAVHMAKTTPTLTVGKIMANYSGARTTNMNSGIRDLSLIVHKGISGKNLVGTRTRCSLCAIVADSITGSRKSYHAGFVSNNTTTKTPQQSTSVPRVFPLERQWQGFDKAAL